MTCQLRHRKASLQPTGGMARGGSRLCPTHPSMVRATHAQRRPAPELTWPVLAPDSQNDRGIMASCCPMTAWTGVSRTTLEKRGDVLVVPAPVFLAGIDERTERPLALL